jgi:hypothetical protein
MSKVVLAFGVVALLVAVAPAQQPQRGQRGGGFGIAGLLDNKDVQKELNLTDDQVEKAKKVVEEVRDKHKDEFDKLPQGQEGFQKRMELGRQVSDETIKQLADVLKPEQTKRLKQLQLQQTARFLGPRIFLTPDVESALKLSDKQKDDLKTLSDDYQKDMQDLRSGGNFNQETFQKMESIRKESMENALKVLDDKQKKGWEDLNGAAFEFRFGGRRPNRNQN